MGPNLEVHCAPYVLNWFLKTMSQHATYFVKILPSEHTKNSLGHLDPVLSPKKGLPEL